MEPIPVPPEARTYRPTCRLVAMGPPPGVSEEDCGTAEMLIDPQADPTLGPGFHGLHAYFRPTLDELAILNAGGYLEFTQYGRAVQPFGARVWPAADSAVQIVPLTPAPTLRPVRDEPQA